WGRSAGGGWRRVVGGGAAAARPPRQCDATTPAKPICISPPGRPIASFGRSTLERWLWQAESTREPARCRRNRQQLRERYGAILDDQRAVEDVVQVGQAVAGEEAGRGARPAG